MFSGVAHRIQRTYAEYPRQFWVIILSTFIDSLGGGIMFPFLTLYITKKFGVGMTEVGTIFLLYAIPSFISSMVGGVLTDRFGRKIMIILGLIASSATTLALGLINSFDALLVMVLITALFADIGQPARRAMIADILPEEQRAQGYGALRVAMNLGVAIGPAIGGFMAARSYFLLFASDAFLSLVTAIVVAIAIKETMSVKRSEETQESVAATSHGYGAVLRHGAFLLFIAAFALVAIIAVQIHSTLPVYLRDAHGIPEQGFGALMSLNAGMVVLLQFPITRRIKQYRPMAMMIWGSLLYGLGAILFGIGSSYVIFIAAIIIITMGEMVAAPIGQALAAGFAPEEMRGRYMAVFNLSYAIPSAIGPLLAGLIIDHGSSYWVWYGAGAFGILAAIAFLGLGNRTEREEAAKVVRAVETSS